MVLGKLSEWIVRLMSELERTRRALPTGPGLTTATAFKSS
jgi:hypothetical protein